MKVAVRSRPSVVWRAALFLGLVMLAAWAGEATAAAPFEDVNDNGIFDGADKDISAVFQTTEFIYYKTPHSIVIPAGSPLTSPEKWAGFYLQAGKSITVNANITSAAYAGLVDLRAIGGRLTIGPGVVLNGRDYLSLAARGDIVLGAGASLVSRGVSANLGTVQMRTETGDIVVGANVKLTTLRDVFMTAVAGDIAVGPGLRLSAPQGMLFADADRVTINGAQLRFTGLIVHAADPVELKGNRLMLPKLGTILVHNPTSTVDLTGTALPKIGVTIVAGQVID